MSDENLISIFIAKQAKPLASYTTGKGFFNQIFEKVLKQINQNSAKMKYNDYMIYYLNENEKIYIILTASSYPECSAISCLESLNKEFGSILNDIDVDNIEEYSLNKQFEEKLKMKYDFYNKNINVTGENIQNLKIEMVKFKDEVYGVNEELNKRGQKIEVIENKAENLVPDSQNFYKSSQNVNKKESNYKCWLTIAIILVILIIIYFVISIICGNWTFQCGQ